MGIAQVYICSRCLRIWDTSSQAISCCGAVARPASICTENVLDEQRRTIENATEENERLLDALKDRQARCSELADKLAERQQTCRDLAATLDKAHAEIDALTKTVERLHAALREKDGDDYIYE